MFSDDGGPGYPHIQLAAGPTVTSTRIREVQPEQRRLVKITLIILRCVYFCAIHLHHAANGELKIYILSILRERPLCLWVTTVWRAVRLLITQRATSTGYRAERRIITAVVDLSSPGQIIIRELDNDETRRP